MSQLGEICNRENTVDITIQIYNQATTDIQLHPDLTPKCSISPEKYRNVLLL